MQISAIEKLSKHSGLGLAVILFILTAILLCNVQEILILFRQDKQLIHLTTSYFHFAAMAMLPILIGSVIAQFFNGIGKPRLMMLISFLTLPFTVFFSYGFILGKLGFPQLGLGGITAATFFSQGLVYSGVLLLITLQPSFKKYAIFSGRFFPDIALCKRIIKLGVPIGAQFAGELAAVAIITYFMGFFGVNALAASQIISQYTLLIVMLTLGLSQSFSILISEAYGRKDAGLIKSYLSCICFILFILFIIISFIFVFYPIHLAELYIKKTPA